MLSFASSQKATSSNSANVRRRFFSPLPNVWLLHLYSYCSASSNNDATLKQQQQQQQEQRRSSTATLASGV
jgi:hypothetical protein